MHVAIQVPGFLGVVAWRGRTSRTHHSADNEELDWFTPTACPKAREEGHDSSVDTVRALIQKPTYAAIGLVKWQSLLMFCYVYRLLYRWFCLCAQLFLGRSLGAVIQACFDATHTHFYPAGCSAGRVPPQLEARR